MNNARLGSEFTDFACDAIIKTQANGEEQICFSYSLVNVSGTMHSSSGREMKVPNARRAVRRSISQDWDR